MARLSVTSQISDYELHLCLIYRIRSLVFQTLSDHFEPDLVFWASLGLLVLTEIDHGQSEKQMASLTENGILFLYLEHY